MTVGEKIRKFRIDQGYTQKELAIMSGLSESAIRNYELGNRFPSSEQLEKIANSLKISPYAMSDPNFDTYVSVMHALFALEDQLVRTPTVMNPAYRSSCLRTKDMIL